MILHYITPQRFFLLMLNYKRFTKAIGDCRCIPQWDNVFKAALYKMHACTYLTGLFGRTLEWTFPRKQENRAGKEISVSIPKWNEIIVTNVTSHFTLWLQCEDHVFSSRYLKKKWQLLRNSFIYHISNMFPCDAWESVDHRSFIVQCMLTHWPLRNLNEILGM